MANIRVTCPACKSELEIGAEHAGQEVECGNCLEVFTAKAPDGVGASDPGPIPGVDAGASSGSGQSKSPSRPPPRKTRRDEERDRRRRYDDDEDDYPLSRSGGGNGLGITSLVLGVVSLLVAIVTMCCCPVAAIPFSLGAIIAGAIGLQNPDSKAMAISGLIMGIVSLGICLAMLVAGGLQMQMNPNQFR